MSVDVHRKNHKKEKVNKRSSLGKKYGSQNAVYVRGGKIDEATESQGEENHK